MTAALQYHHANMVLNWSISRKKYEKPRDMGQYPVMNYRSLVRFHFGLSSIRVTHQRVFLI